MDFDQLFEAAANEFTAAFKRSAVGVRPDEKGGPREQQLRRFLSDWLAQEYGIANGYIINQQRQISDQCDVILYKLQGCPKFVLDKDTDRRLIPFEGVYGVIESKSTLGLRELNDALRKIESVDKLYEMHPNYQYRIEDEYEERDIKVVEVEPSINFWQPKRFIADNEWRYFKVQVSITVPYRSRVPFSIIFTYRLDTDLTFTKIKQIFQSKQYIPDAVVALDSGIMMYLNRDSLKRYKSLRGGNPADSYNWDEDVIMTHIKQFDGVEYIIEDTPDSKVTLLFFYVFLLELLKQQLLPNYNPMDLVAAWRAKER